MATMRPQFLGHGSEPNSGVTFRRGPILDQKTSLFYGTPHDTHSLPQVRLWALVLPYTRDGSCVVLLDDTMVPQIWVTPLFFDHLATRARPTF